MAATLKLVPITIQSGETLRMEALSAVDSGSLSAFLARMPFYGVDRTAVLETCDNSAAEFVLITILLGSVHIGRLWPQ